MRQLIWSRLHRQPGRAAALMIGILVASTSFTLLTAAVRTSQLVAIGTVRHNARSAYDVLVRPPGTKTPLERRAGLVQDNFLAGIYGGITLAQYHEIAKINGVEAAAPAANLGYIVVEAFIPVSVRPYLTNAPYQAFRLNLRYVVGRGQHVFDDASLYVYVTRDRLTDPATAGWEVQDGRKLGTCLFFNSDPHGIPATASEIRRDGYVGRRLVRSPFDPLLRSQLNCVSRRTGANFDRYPGITTVVNVEMPVQVTAIDPGPWNRLIGLGHAIVSGRMLRPDDSVAADRIAGITHSGIPVLLTSRPYAAERLDVQVQRLNPAGPADLPAELSTPAAYRYLTHLRGRRVGHLTIPLRTAYARAHEPLVTQYSAWMPAPVSYLKRPDGLLAVRDLGSQPPGVWSEPVMGFDPAAPIDNTADQVRRIAVIRATGQLDAPGLPVVVGRFDPSRLRGFSALSAVPLETFRAPVATGADTASRGALGDQPLQPDRNLGGYLEQPPALLTTLAAIPAFMQSRSITATTSRELAAPISAIMIRVGGVTGIDALSRARVAEVASAIHRMFPKLVIDVTLGSSPEPQTIALPAGVATPASVQVTEGWTKIGVALAIARALDRESALLFLLILLVCGLFLGHATFAAVRNRSAEIGTLRGIGWSSVEIFALTLAEAGASGLIAGAVGAGLAALLIGVLKLTVSAWYPVAVVPVAVALAVLAGAWPAWHAARIGPLGAISRPVSKRSRARPVRGIGGLAVRDLTRVPGRTLLGAIALALAIAALTVLLAVTIAFRGEVSFSLLGGAVVAQARQVDYVSAGLALVLAVAGALDVLVISLRERAPELALLRACGWSQHELGRLVLLEGLGTGVTGGVLGATAGLTVVAALGNGIPAAAIVTSATAAVGGALLIMITAAAPAARLTRIAPASALSSELHNWRAGK